MDFVSWWDHPNGFVLFLWQCSSAQCSLAVIGSFKLESWFYQGRAIQREDKGVADVYKMGYEGRKYIKEVRNSKKVVRSMDWRMHVFNRLVHLTHLHHSHFPALVKTVAKNTVWIRVLAGSYKISILFHFNFV